MLSCPNHGKCGDDRRAVEVVGQSSAALLATRVVSGENGDNHAGWEKWAI
jgi:hypothetical protein